ncbi:MAG: hypothetical protein A2W98_02240 [Bacteroidetes bacterium GWF2_33_38]|nr:MAG: hypothetical protein A2W98_02240 [Bacteroidetes bacterium GWF2_33_38]OFY73812.1 MAG: hypothetical protein A2265_00870 [Bacteroidetes bacterium RIFOXYA12_FULL_33_9]OFY89411.1 MAG: hypothetical protein A2236_14070 [Bacteroidetes bacterium RIFOXYA2_FULL_33_7]HBX51647.1 hypothetical protein [Bacteroidales bacterium]
METVNLGTIRKIKQKLLLINIAFIAIMGVVAMTDYFKDIRIFSIVSVVVLYLIVLFFISLFKFSYVYFNNSGDKITFRYYPIRIIARKYKAIEIPKDKFLGYKIQQYLNLREEIILVQNVKNKNIEYPPISLSALKKQEKEKIYNALKRKLEK